MICGWLLAASLFFVSVVAEQCHAGCAATAYLSKPLDFPRTDMPKHTPGLHVLCISIHDSRLHVLAYKHAIEGTPIKFSMKLNNSTSDLAVGVSFGKLRKRIAKKLKITKKTTDWGHYELKQRWRLFTTTGDLINTTPRVLEEQTVLLMEGGQFVWAPVRVGHIQTKQYSNKTMQIETLSLQPLVLSIKHFLEPHECEKIITMADGRMHNSGVSHMDHDKGKEAKVFSAVLILVFLKISSSLLFCLLLLLLFCSCPCLYIQTYVAQAFI